MVDRSMRRRSAAEVRVVSHHPWRRLFLILAVLLLSGAGSMAGYWLGRSTAELDRVQLASLERLDARNRETIAGLRALQVEAELKQQVDREAALALKDSLRESRDEIAALTEEVTFYKSLMAPSSVAKGLQIGDFELLTMDQPDRFTFHLLLTQVESRRDWVQGDVDLEVHGRMVGSDSATGVAEQVLSLTEIAEDGTYPLTFRFRYFQDLTGVIRLPAGFEPHRVVVRAGKRGASADAPNRTFEWIVAS